MKKNKIIILGYIFWIVCMVIFVLFYQKETDLNLHESFSYEMKELPQVETIRLNLDERITSSKSKSSQSFYPLTEHERWLVESIVAGESGIEPCWGKVGVASCILNACLLEDKRPEEIQTMYGYAGWKPIEEFKSECMAAYGNTDLADEVCEAVSQVFDNGEVLNDEILWFYAPKYSSGTFHQTQKFVIEIGGHRFYGPSD